ncbi:MAG: 3,4-dihydroxy-2-butanone-4-phosphate synthase [Planctomycetes bacterium]|nr:3,4-dihydroxy-2-butanone-4-phosphate synthase [Planctomycetota bacterium]
MTTLLTELPRTSTIPEILEDIYQGKPIILVDAADREDEGDLVIAAEKADQENLAFMARYARGIMCIPCDGLILDRLNIPMMVERSNDRLQTPFTVSIDAARGISTGVPVADRLKTIQVLLDPNSKPSDLTRPGHLFPLRPHQMGLRGRQGHTESSIELMRLAGLKPVAVISEIMNDDGTMARGEPLLEFAAQFNLRIISIQDIIDHLDTRAASPDVTALILTAGSVREDIIGLSGTNCSAMISVNGKPAIYWNLSYLIGLGIHNFIVVSRPDMRALRTYTDALFGAVAEIRFVDGNPSGGPGDSLLSGLRYVKTPGALVVLGDTVFNFNDPEERTIQELDDFILVEETSDCDRWCMAQISANSVIQKLIDKKPDREPGSKALIGVYKVSDARLLAAKLEEAAARKRLDRPATEISEGLTLYGLHKPIKAISPSKWLDLGNPNNLIGSRKKSIVVRAYNSFSFDNLLGTITKRSEDAKLEDEINYYKELPGQVAIFFPRLISSNPAGKVKEMTLEYYGYPNLGELLTYGTVSPDHWRRIISNLDEILELWRKTAVSKGNPQYSQDIYIYKTEREFARLEAQSKEFRRLANQETICLNGKEYSNFPYIWPQIKRFSEEKLMEYRSSVIHGDCCLANILYDSKSDTLRFVDPRGSFGAKGVTGDSRYDAAKLYHSFDGGYEFLINDMFALEQRGEHKLKLINGESKESARETFEEIFFRKFDRREIKTIEGLLYISMCARHYDSQRRQTAMYLTGVRLLNESLNF